MKNIGSMIQYNRKGGEKITKETLTLEAIKSDLVKIADCQVSNRADWRFSYIVPFTVIAIIMGILMKNVLIGIAIFGVAAYHIGRFIMEFKEYRAKKGAILSLIERGEVSISIQALSHIASEVIYEPHAGIRRTRATKSVTMYYFDGGASWRLPMIPRHYDWSRQSYLSPGGLANISLSGDQFYFVSLQEHHDISYIYPCKLFRLDEGLEKGENQ